MKAAKTKTTRQIAKEHGERLFDLGVNCVRGHGTMRLTRNVKCPRCQAEQAKNRSDEYKQRNKDSKREKYQNDAEYREILKARRAAYYLRVGRTEEFKQKERDRSRQRYEDDPVPSAAGAAIRRGRKINATPAWLTTEQRQEMEEIYREAKRITEATSVQHQVDHIIPLQGKTVCGLHVPWNLRILPSEDNRRKWHGLPSEAIDQIGHTKRSIYVVVA